jgi:predicted phosphodiesterase
MFILKENRMKKILIFSDLHREEDDDSEITIQDDADIIVIAGDLSSNRKQLVSSLKSIKKECIFVCGNHEHFNFSIEESIDDLKNKLKENTNIHILNKEKLTIDNITFIGCTLWTDFSISGDQENSKIKALTEYKDVRDERIKDLSPEKIVDIFEKEKSFIFRNTMKKNDKEEKFIVITHFGPTRKSLNYSFKKNNEYFTSELSDLITHSEIDYWIHGHTHHSSDYIVGGTRVICNPRGMITRKLNDTFNPNFILEI